MQGYIKKQFSFADRKITNFVLDDNIYTDFKEKSIKDSYKDFGEKVEN